MFCIGKVCMLLLPYYFRIFIINIGKLRYTTYYTCIVKYNV